MMAREERKGRGKKEIEGKEERSEGRGGAVRGEKIRMRNKGLYT